VARVARYGTYLVGPGGGELRHELLPLLEYGLPGNHSLLPLIRGLHPLLRTHRQLIIQGFTTQHVTIPKNNIIPLITSVADPDPGSRIRCLFDPWIRDQGWVKIRIRDEQPGSYFRELRSGMKKIWIRNKKKHSGSATLLITIKLP
jgi:hypothetical protein